MHRVLHVLEATLGGTGTYLNQVIQALSPDRWECGLIYSEERADAAWPATLELARQSGWSLFEVPMRRALSPLSDAQGIAAARRVMDRYRPAIVHGHSAKGGAVARLAAAGSRRGEVVYSPHSAPAHLGKQYWMIERALSRLTTRFVAVSDSEAEELVALALAPRSTVDIVYPVITSCQPESREVADIWSELGWDRDRVRVILGVGRLAPQKDPLRFVRIVAQVCHAFPECRAVWVGDGELRGDCERQVREAGLEDRVRFVGWRVSAPYYAAATVLLSTAAYESFGFAVAEALGAGRPVVASAVTGTTDVMCGDLSRWLYPPGDEGAAVTLLGALLSDTQLRAAVGDVGRTSVIQRFSMEAMSRAIERAYENTLQGE